MDAPTNMEKRRAPEPSATRTHRDRIMIGLAALLILFFLVAGWLAFKGKDNGTGRKLRGPVKDPNVSEIVGMERFAKAFDIHRTVEGSAANRLPSASGHSCALPSCPRPG